MNKLSIIFAGAGIAVLGSHPVMADIVHADDVIIQFSECVGNDCVNGESFGFDTVRLKENNLRIHFDDTSSSSSFPRNDWRIVINDTSNGGASYFAIEDSTAGKTPFKVSAGAPNNALYVDSGGDVGFGTSNPVVDMHAVSGNTPTLRLEQDGSSGFSPQTWDVAGNETNFFVRDVTNGSKLPFKVIPNANNNSLYVAAGTKVGIGTNSPEGPAVSALFEVGAGSGNNVISIDSGSSASNYGEILFQEANTDKWSFGNGANADNFYIYNYTQSRNEIQVLPNGNIGLGGVNNPTNPLQHANGAILTAAGVWQNASSRELKTGIKALTAEDAIATLVGLEPVTYRYKREPDDLTVGFIAEDVPELVATASHKTLSPMDIVAVLTKVVQEQQKTIAKLEASVKELNDNRIVILEHPTARID